MVPLVWVIIGCGNGLSPNGTKPFLQSMLTYHQWYTHKHCCIKEYLKGSVMKCKLHFLMADILLRQISYTAQIAYHDQVVKWKHFPHCWSFVRGIHQSLMDSPHKGQWHMSFDVFFQLHLIKRLSKQSRCQWFGMPLGSLWRHYYGQQELFWGNKSSSPSLPKENLKNPNDQIALWFPLSFCRYILTIREESTDNFNGQVAPRTTRLSKML